MGSHALPVDSPARSRAGLASLLCLGICANVPCLGTTWAAGDERHCLFYCPHFHDLRSERAELFDEAHSAMRSVMSMHVRKRDRSDFDIRSLFVLALTTAVTTAVILAIVNEAQHDRFVIIVLISLCWLYGRSAFSAFPSPERQLERWNGACLRLASSVIHHFKGKTRPNL